MSANARLDIVCSTFDIKSIASSVPLINLLDELSKDLAKDKELRATIGHAEPSIWPHLCRLWSATASAHQVADREVAQPLPQLCLSLARFTRNISAAVPSNQEQSFENEPAIRVLLHHYTSFYVVEDKDCLPVTRMLIQTLSNLVTANGELIRRIWKAYMDLPVEMLVLIRLFGVSDEPTVLSTMVFILNCVHTSRQLAELLTTSANGTRLSISLLDQMALLFDKEEFTDGGRAFEIGYTIVTRLIEEGLVPELYRRISMAEEVVTPHQTILLKLLDSYLHSSNSSQTLLSIAYHRPLCDMLITCFFALSTYAQQSIRRALGANDARSFSAVRLASGSTRNQKRTDLSSTESLSHVDSVAAPLQEVDVLLPKICEALVLTTQCLISLLLQSEESGKIVKGASYGREEQPDTTDGNRVAEPLKGYVSDALSPNGSGLVESLIGTLQLFDLFLPRITFGKVAPTPVLAGGGDPSKLPLNSNASAPPTSRDDDSDRNVGAAAQAKTTLSVDPKGFLYLKRDFVRLLGILSYQSNAVQDRVRVCGGIPVVLNLCVVDERNPYLREHAIFTLHNLLRANPENQAVVDEIQPIRDWDDESGELRGRPRM